MEDIKRLIINRLKTAREEAGFTQGELADLLGMARSSYAQIETGRNSLSIEKLAQLPEILNKSVNYVLGMGTEDLTADETELLELYRAIPPGDLKENVLNIVRTTAQQARKPGGSQEAGQIADELEEQTEELMETVKGLRARKKE